MSNLSIKVCANCQVFEFFEILFWTSLTQVKMILKTVVDKMSTVNSTATYNEAITTAAIQQESISSSQSPKPKKKAKTMTLPKAKKAGKTTQAKNIQQIFQHQQNDLLQQMKRVLTSFHKQQIFAELSQTQGITRPEILRELEALSEEAESNTSADDILMMIVAKREMLKSSHQSNEAHLKAQEDAILDQVILLSEGERENIQVCLCAYICFILIAISHHNQWVFHL